MKQDNALKKVLETMEVGDLPYGFENRMMKQILLEAERKKRRVYLWTLGLLSFVSLAMVAGVILILKYYLKVEMPLPEIHNPFSAQAGSTFGFFFYIAFLVLLLLGMDTIFRRLRSKSHQ